MDLQSFVKKPIVRITACVVIIYVVLVGDSKHRNTFLDNISLSKITGEITQVKNKYDEISNKIETVKKIQDLKNIKKTFEDLTFEELFSGVGDDVIKCSDKVKLIYKIFNDQLKIVDFSVDKELIIAQQNENSIDKILVKAIKDRRIGASVRVLLAGSYNFADEKLKKLLDDNFNKLTIEINILSLTKGDENESNNCLN
ncbi:hypothetical protein LBMAG18_06180 [Alphaproteobacteria bacterium]|nr:hypothetical protein LBMAG18_06180 [Alphaproteobacteria bacterium]